MKTFIAISFSLAILTAPLSRASTVTWSDGPSAIRGLDATGVNLTPGNLIMAGIFATPGGVAFNSSFSLATNVANITSAGGWKQFGFDPTTSVFEATQFTLAVNASSKIAGTVQDDLLGASFFNGKTAYVWIFNATTVGAATQMGIFSASPSWTFPNNGLGAGGDIGSFGSSPGAGVFLTALGGAGSIGPLTASQPTGTFNLALTGVAAVPEPATLAVGLLTLMAVMLPRVRRRNFRTAFKSPKLKKSLFCAFSLTVFGICPARATTVTWSDGPSAIRGLDATGVNLTPGNLIMAGTFATPGGIAFNSSFDMATNVANITSAGGWKRFGFDPTTSVFEATQFTLAVNASSKIAGTIQDDLLGASFFNGKTAYVWIFDATTIGAARQMGIFSASPSWLFPNNGLGAGGDIGSYGSSPGAGVTLSALGGAGSIGPITASQPTGTFNLVATAPEPSSLTLFALAGAGLLSARHRKRQV